MGYRIAIISNVLPLAGPLAERLRELGHEPVAWLMARRADQSRPLPPWGEVTDSLAPPGLSVLLAADKDAVAPLLRGLDLDLTLCWGFNWKLPNEALDVPRLGSVNQHPGFLPRHRGPYPMAWALRDGDGRFGLTWHRMDADFDTGSILAQTTVPIDDTDTTIEHFGAKLLPAALDLLPQVLERIEAGDPGDPQPSEGATWAPAFDEDYATVDWTQPARAIHDQVRAWHLTFGSSKVPGPIAELDGASVKLLQTSMTDPGNGARPVECGDGQIWIVESEPA